MLKNKTKRITFSALSIALATVMATVIKMPSLPNGGSITLFSMLIVSIVGYCYGPATGITAAITYSILQFITGPYVLHPIQVILDYPLAFGALGLSGFFYNKKNGLIWGYVVGVLGRYFCHVISGLIFYTTYVGNFHGNIAIILGVLLYNASYVLLEGSLTLIVLAFPPVRNALSAIKRMATAN